MASTYSTNLGIELPGTGDQAGVWGNTTNTNLGTLIEQAISGYVTQAVATGTDTTITIPNGATGVARNMYLELTGTGGASTNLIVPANKKLYFIFNNTSSGQVTVKVSGQTGISVPNGKKMILVSNGTDIVTAENYVASLSTDNLSLTGNLTLSGGTANGVLYLNGSKVATSGSALTFDGLNVLSLGSGGTANTATALTLNATDNAANGSYILGKRNGTNVWLIGDTSSGLGSGTGFISYNYGTAPWIWYLQTGGEQMRLTSTGLGIGTNNPTDKLDVFVSPAAAAASGLKVRTASITAQLAITGSTYTNYGVGPNTVWLFSDTSNLALGPYGGTGSVQFVTGGSLRATLDQSGNFGIGTASPGAKLESAGTSNGATLELLRLNNIGSGANTQAQINFIAASTSYGTITGGFGSAAPQMTFNLPNATAGNFVWQITSTERMRLDSSGNLGIGTTVPGNYGQFVTNTSGTPTLAYASILSAAGVYAGGFESTLYLGAARTDIIDNGQVAGYRFKVSSGSSAGGNLSIEAASRATGSTSPPNVFSSYVTLTAAGNLGIGTASPSTKLHVVNDTAATNSAVDVLTLTQSSTGTAASGLGAGILFQSERPSGGVILKRGAIYGVAGAVDPNDDGDLAFYTLTDTGPSGFSEKMRLDSSGNLGLGVTPSAWATLNVFQLSRGSVAATTAEIDFSHNAYYDGAWKYIANGFATNHYQASGAYVWRTAPSGTAGNAITFTQALTLDASGNLGLGNTNPASYGGFVAQLASGIALHSNSTSGVAGLNLYENGTGRFSLRTLNGSAGLSFYDTFNATERGRFNAGGELLINTTNTSVSGGPGFKVLPSANGTDAPQVAIVTPASTSTTSSLSLYSTGAAAFRFYVVDSGTIYATTTTITGISDRRLKENIQDIDVGLEKILALKPRKFDWKEGKGKDKKGDRGWIADEFKLVFPDMVEKWLDAPPEGEDPYEAVNADLIPVLVKAIQELSAKVAALEAK